MPERHPPIELQGISLAELQKLARGAQAAAGRPVESGSMRPFGNAHRPRRNLVPRGLSDPRPAMVRLFSTVLRREPDGRHVLVTPVEKLDIDVESTAFRAVEMNSEGEGRRRRIAFRLDSGDAVILGQDHPLRIASEEHGPSPRILVRHGLEAELVRPVYYELAEIALAEGHDPAGIWSNGAFFPLEEGE